MSYSSAQSEYVNTVFGIVNENNLSEQEKTLRDLASFLQGHLDISNTNYSRFMAMKPYMETILKKPETVLTENENLASSLAILSRHIGNVEKENPQ